MWSRPPLVSTKLTKKKKTVERLHQFELFVTEGESRDGTIVTEDESMDGTKNQNLDRLDSF